MRKSEFTPPHIQKAIDAKERLLKARTMYEAQKEAMKQYDAMYEGKTTDNTLNYDRQEINFWMSP